MGPLSFLGNGAAFNFNSNNNCAYFIDKNCLYLIDCGEKIFDHILEKELLKKLEYDENVKELNYYQKAIALKKQVLF